MGDAAGPDSDMAPAPDAGPPSGTGRPSGTGPSSGAGPACDPRPSPPVTHDIAEHLFALVDRLHLDFETAVAGFELSSAQAKALRFLAEAGPVPMRDLATCLRCDASNVTGLVDRLELRGLVERRTSHGDRRVKTLVVTDAGAEIASRMWTQVVTGMVSMAGLAEQEQHALLDLLRRLGQEPAARCWVTRPAAD